MDFYHVSSSIVFCLILTVCCSSLRSVEYTTKSCKFTCKYNIPIPCSYRCDGQKDCPYGEDESECNNSLDSLYLSVKPEVVVVRQGQTIQVNCSTRPLEAQILDFKWQALGHDLQDDLLFRQIRVEKYVVSLLIPNAQPENTGVYRCKLHTADGRHNSKVVQIRVNKTASLHLDISPKKIIGNPLIVQRHETIQVNCTTTDLNVPISDLKWEVDREQQNVKQVRYNGNTICLQIAKAEYVNSGTYVCKLFTAFGETAHIDLQIQVTALSEISLIKELNSGAASSAVENTKKFCRFICKPNYYIGCHYKCDGQINCPFGEDEKDCPEMICEGKFRCNNSRCIDYAYVCDKMNHCNDWSDEDRCTTVTTDSVPSDSTEEEDNQMIWLKTTVYTVIACTVGIVFLISVIVIAIFRIKMKRAAVRRTLRQAERRRRQSNRCESQNNSRPRTAEHVEQEPFISAPSPTHFGNIIVNVNNGVQYVPNAEFTVGVQSPPTYSDVMAETGRVGRHSPPPEYSTIDRNPNRISQIQDSELHTQLLSEGRSGDNPEPYPGSDSLESSSSPCDTRSVQHNVNAGDNNSVTDRTDDVPTTACTEITSSSNGTSSLGRRERAVHTRGHARNVRSLGSPRRPKQLKVLDGQIVLDDDSSNSSSPDTVHRNTQTNPADISSLNQNLKPAQIQVQAGQIVLANQEAESPVSPSDSDGAFAQGQLDVKDGHIVFKPS